LPGRLLDCFCDFNIFLEATIRDEEGGGGGQNRLLFTVRGG
jgi:hypothetical protein